MNATIKNIFVSTTLLSMCCLNASDAKKPDGAQQYPFSEIDKALFYNATTQKIESPYSTASVETFSDIHLKIEKYAYDALRVNALQRSKAILTAYKQQNTETTNQNTLYESIITAATQCYEKFNNFKPVSWEEDTQTMVQISERTLMHLLQWARSIKTVWYSLTPHLSDFDLEISLDTRHLKASELLKKFVALDTVRYHQQEKIDEWA